MSVRCSTKPHDFDSRRAANVPGPRYARAANAVGTTSTLRRLMLDHHLAYHFAMWCVRDTLAKCLLVRLTLNLWAKWAGLLLYDWPATTYEASANTCVSMHTHTHNNNIHTNTRRNGDNSSGFSVARSLAYVITHRRAQIRTHYIVRHRTKQAGMHSHRSAQPWWQSRAHASLRKRTQSTWTYESDLMVTVEAVATTER